MSDVSITIPTSGYCAQMYGAERLIAASPSFQERIGVATAAAARDHIFINEIAQPLNETEGEGRSLSERWPFVLLLEQDFAWRQIGEGNLPHLGASGGVLVIFTEQHDCNKSHKDGYYHFADWVGSVIDDVRSLVATDPGGSEQPYFPFMAIELLDRPVRTPLGSRSEDFWDCSWLLRHNVDGEA